MPISPLISFKAGIVDLDTDVSPPRAKPSPTPGYIYLYIGEDDEMVHFCWRPRSATEATIDLLMIPGDASFTPYTKTSSETTKGRIYVLKFSSSNDSHLFWLQSASQHASGDLSWFSPRDLKLGEIVNDLLQGEEVDVQASLAEANNQSSGDGDDDETMEDIEGTGQSNEHHRGGSGGAGPDATGGDIREEGQGSREGGADGGRAAESSNYNSTVQDFLRSLGSGGAAEASQAHGERQFASLADLFTPTSTIPAVEAADEATIDRWLDNLPPTLLFLAQDIDDVPEEPNPNEAKRAMESLSLVQKKDIVRRVLRSPQFAQSLGSLTSALRDGGLPSISEALRIPAENGGFVRGSGMPLGGSEAVEAFVKGIKKDVEDNKGDQMDME